MLERLGRDLEICCYIGEHDQAANSGSQGIGKQRKRLNVSERLQISHVVSQDAIEALTAPPSGFVLIPVEKRLGKTAHRHETSKGFLGRHLSWQLRERKRVKS